MFYSVRLFSQAPLARGSRALPSVLLNSCIYSIHVFMIFKFMYLLFLKYLLFLTIKLFLCFIYYYFETCLLLYPFYDLMIFIYNPKELKLSSRKQYK